MYHYKTSGLKNVWLKNGYHLQKTPYGEGMSIENLDGLHRCIATHLITSEAKLNGDEFRFLRIELNMSQNAFGKIVGVSNQAVAIWEKRNKVPKYADIMIRTLCHEIVIKEDATLSEVIHHLNDLDRKAKHKIVFQETSEGWVPQAA